MNAESNEVMNDREPVVNAIHAIRNDRSSNLIGESLLLLVLRKATLHFSFFDTTVYDAFNKGNIFQNRAISTALPFQLVNCS